MANFDPATRAKIASVYTASRLIQVVYSVYIQAKSATTLIDLYAANTDPVFVAAVNAMLSTQERQELNQALTAIRALVTDLETNHATLISSG